MVTNTTVYCLFDVFFEIFALRQHQTIQLPRPMMADVEKSEEQSKSQSHGTVTKIAPKTTKKNENNDNSNENKNKNNNKYSNMNGFENETVSVVYVACISLFVCFVCLFLCLFSFALCCFVSVHVLFLQLVSSGATR